MKRHGMIRVFAAALTAAVLLMSLAACSSSPSLPPELRGKTMPQPNTFMSKYSGDKDIDYAVDTYDELAVSVLGGDSYVGYSSYDNTVYFVYYAAGVNDIHKAIDSSKQFIELILDAKGTAGSPDLDKFGLGFIAVSGRKTNSELEILYILKGTEIIANYVS